LPYFITADTENGVVLVRPKKPDTVGVVKIGSIITFFVKDDAFISVFDELTPDGES